MKTCATCKKEFPKESFHKTSSSCKPCKSEYSKEYNKKKKKRNKYAYNWS